MKLLLLPLFLAACLPVEHTSQDLKQEAPGGILLVVDEKVNSFGKKYEAYTSELKFKERESFEKPVKLKVGVQLKDKAPLKISAIKFSYATDDSVHNCELINKELMMSNNISFSSSDCNKTQATAVYGQYLLSSVDGNTKLELAVKIEIGRDGKPSRLHVKDFTNGDDESITLIWNNDKKGWSGEDYTLGYPNSAESIAKMIGNKKLPSLTQGQGHARFFAEEAKAVLSAKQYEALLPEPGDVNTGLASACEGNSDFESHINSEFKGYSYLEFRKDGVCDDKSGSGKVLRLYGFNTQAVANYLTGSTSCNVTCPFSTGRHGSKEEFRILFNKDYIYALCEDFKHGLAFYVDKNKLHIVDSQGDDKALWYNCYDSSYGRLGDAATTKTRSAQSSAGDSKIRSRE